MNHHRREESAAAFSFFDGLKKIVKKYLLKIPLQGYPPMVLSKHTWRGYKASSDFLSVITIDRYKRGVIKCFGIKRNQ